MIAEAKGNGDHGNNTEGMVANKIMKMAIGVKQDNFVSG